MSVQLFDMELMQRLICMICPYLVIDSWQSMEKNSSLEKDMWVRNVKHLTCYMAFL